MKKYKREIIIVSSSFALLITVSIISDLIIGREELLSFQQIASHSLLFFTIGILSCIIAALYALFFIRKKKFLARFKKAYFIIYPSICILISCGFLVYIPSDKKMHDEYQEWIKVKAMSLSERLDYEMKTNENWQQDSSLIIYESSDSIFPSNIKEFKHVKSLSISETNIKTLPKELSELKNLTKLSLSKNKIDTLPEVIFELEQLQELTLGNNNLKYISSNIKKLQKLKWLNFYSPWVEGNEPYTNIPKEIGELQSLVSLYLSVPNIDSLPTNLANAKNITQFMLADTEFDKFPPLIFEMTNLEHLTLFFNYGSLPPIPDDFKKLTKLKTFTIRGCNRTPEQKARLQELLPNLEIEW